MASSLPTNYDKRLMLFSGRANPELAAKIADKLGVDLGPVTLKTFSSGEVYSPLRRVDPRRGRLPRPAAVRQPRRRHHGQRRAHGAAAHDRRGRRRLGAPRDRGHAVVRLQPPGQEVRPARADLRAPRGAHARGGGRRPRAHHGPPRRPDPGLLQRAVRPHDRAHDAHAVLRRPRAAGPRRRRAGRRPREAQQEVRLEDRRRARDPRQGAPRAAGRRDRLRHRRRARAARRSSSTT